MSRRNQRRHEKRNNTPAYDTYFANVLNTPVVNAKTAESISTVYACISAISETIASLPFEVFKRTDAGREKAKAHPLYKLIHDKPNHWQTALEFREMLQRHVLLRGNAYAEIKRDRAGITALIPLHPDSVTVLLNNNGYLVYDVIQHDGSSKRLLADEVLHLRFHPSDSTPYLGRSPIQVAQDTISLSLSEQQHGTNTFNNGTSLNGVIETLPTTTKDQAKSISDSWKANYSGVKNAGTTPVLPSGAKFTPVSMSLIDSQWLESRQFSVLEVCRLFRVQPTIVGVLDNANYSNSVELARQFVTLTLKRHLLMWEQAINNTCLTDDYYCEHNLDGLLRGDNTNRAAFYQSALSNQWMTIDEVRELENLPVGIKAD
ncbi:phage portal protein (plasmid) [Acinetobacter schindleri]|uniref:phage portal protein n=1 Tax=Acinetobacter schindleri TaxID=108981 RepID=UPI0013B0A52C|nr:phage portal protein [Acinetobacter schindleri]QIC62701.1 phage portal protein [Acinetobacter schindleri]